MVDKPFSESADCSVTGNKLIFPTLHHTVLISHSFVAGFKEI